MQVSTIINRQDIHYMNITNKCNKQSKIYYESDKYNMEGAYIYIYTFGCRQTTVQHLQKSYNTELEQ